MEARVDKLSTAEEAWDLDDVLLRLATWERRIRLDLDERKKGVAGDLTTLLAYINALEAQCEKQDSDYVNLEAPVRNLTANMLNRGT